MMPSTPEAAGSWPDTSGNWDWVEEAGRPAWLAEQWQDARRVAATGGAVLAQLAEMAWEAAVIGWHGWVASRGHRRWNGLEWTRER